MAPGLLFLLLLLQACLEGLTQQVFPPALSAYRRIQRREGEALSVKCSSQSHKNPVEPKVWCKVRIKKCEPSFSRPWVTGPRFTMQDDAQGRTTITMADLKQQDSGRYWCMRGGVSGHLFPLEGFLLEVSSARRGAPAAAASEPGKAPALKGLVTDRGAPITRLPDDNLRSGIVVATGEAPTSGPDTSFTSTVAAFTPRPLTWASLWPSTALGTPRPTSVIGSSLTSLLTMGDPKNTLGPQAGTVSPAGANSPVSVSSWPSGGLLTSEACRDQLPSTRLQEPHLTTLVVLLSLLPVPVMLAMVYKFWKKKYMGSYHLGRDSVGPWTPSVRRRAPVEACLV
ncbi:trem-like transcript 2 protein [Octodon degus]|uniref:Trem-like transcript 2 protein n=1 Tax=Octodon degus TaxID=10160 RepID=A0A6P6F233_OCTDE|nr:trem-like transcript 2 protein [Octodon degus]